MLIAVAIGIVLILLGMLVLNKNEKQDKPEIIEEEKTEINDKDLAYFKLFYKYNEVQANKTIVVYTPYTCFRVEGYSLKGYRLILDESKIKWSSPCGVVKFDNDSGYENCISCNTKGDYRRSISVKYQNGVTFSFKLVFK